MLINSYWSLARLNKPIGIILLWSPTAWTLWIAFNGHPQLQIIIIFLLGTIIMRSVGCVINDIIDRNIDLHVARTCDRPLITGEISLIYAIFFCIILLICAVVLLLQLPQKCFIYAIIALFITILYPFCKRFFISPQLILGIAFSMSMPMIYIAANKTFDQILSYLLLLNILWVLAYDTQYAMVDRDDDKKIKIQSTALLFNTWSKSIICGLQIIVHLLWLLLAYKLHFNHYFLIFWAIGLLIFIYQQRQQYFKAFLNNSWYGLIMWLGIICSFR